MEIASAGNSVLERYPELLFLLHYTPFSPYEIFEGPDGKCNARSEEGDLLHTDALALELERFFRKLNLKEVDILYLYGIGMGHHYGALKEWLKEKRERRLIILEESLGALSAAAQSEFADSLFSDPQVTVCFNEDPKKWDSHLEQLAYAYSTERIEIAAIDSYQKQRKKSFRSLRLKLLRLSAVAHALMTEVLYAHKLLPNLLRNIKKWPRSFLAGGLKDKFKNVPAIICGAGPSLSDSFSTLKKLEDRALIIAGGSTIAALSNHGIIPHLGLALDPNLEEFGRLKIASAFEMPLIYASRLQPDVFNTLNGEMGYLVSDTGGPCERFFEREMELSSDPIGPELGLEALSVTTLAIALAVEMGCNPILFNGIDLAYTGMRRYAAGIVPCSAVKLEEMRNEMRAPERMLKRKDIHGHYVHTLVKWVMESDCIAAYAKAHSDRRFYNVSSSGLGFSDIHNTSLDALLESELATSFDLRGRVHAEVQRLKSSVSSDRLARKMQEVCESLMRLGSIAEEILEELDRIKEDFPFNEQSFPTGKMTLLEMDFQEEVAFEALFPALGTALNRLLDRAFYSSPLASDEEKRRVLINRNIAKWKQWKEMIDSEISVFIAYKD